MKPALHEVIAWGLAVSALAAMMLAQIFKGIPVDVELRALFIGAITIMLARGTRGAGDPPPPPQTRSRTVRGRAEQRALEPPSTDDS